MNAGSDWPSSRALPTLKPSRRRWTLNSIWTIQQTARNCAGQFSILSPGEKRQSKKGVVEILSFPFWQAFCGAILDPRNFSAFCPNGRKFRVRGDVFVFLSDLLVD